MNFIYKPSKLLFLAIGIFSACLFGGSSSFRFNDTDELVRQKQPFWLAKTIKPMSAKDQLDSLNTFEKIVSTHRTQTGRVIPLGPESKAQLQKMSSWLYSNLVAESFNQSDLPSIIKCAIALSESFFSNHYLFNALEYQLWTYNHQLLNDLEYTRLFYAMSQSQYFPNDKTFQEGKSSHSGFDFHAHLGEIVVNQIWLGENHEDVAHVLTNIIIGYNMMSGSELDSIEAEFKRLNLMFPLDKAIDALANLLDTCRNDSQKRSLIISISNRKNLYKALLLDFICKTDPNFSADACFDSTQNMTISDALKRQRKLILKMREVINYKKPTSGKPASKFEEKIGEKLSTLGYTVESNVYDPNLCCEIDFVVTPPKGQVIRIEADGYFHFNQNFHGQTLTQDLNGLTRLQTNLLRKFGRVFRISSACNSGEYYKRINSIFDIFKKFDASQDRVRFLPDGGEYRTCK